MKTQSIIIAVLSVALVFAVIKIVICKKTESMDSSKNAVIENIMTRTSVRAYNGEPITDEQIETLLRAGMAAPSAVNKQPWKFVVVKNRELLKQIADSLPNARMSVNAACAIAVCGDMTKTLDGVGREFWIHDCSAATQNILLAAHALGLGAVWTGIYPNIDRNKVAQDLLQLPETQLVLCIIPIGWPAENPTPKDKWKEENYKVIE